MLTVLLPAAGFGKRNPGHEVKELMLQGGKPLIENSFDLLNSSAVKDFLAKIVIITRVEKRLPFEIWLAQYSRQKAFDVPVYFHLLEPEGHEWPFSLLSARGYWGEKNLVLLPDTRLELGMKGISEIDFILGISSSVWAVKKMHHVQLKSYGVVTRNGNEALTVTEKPISFVSSWVWGAFGFRREVGVELLQALEKSTFDHSKIELPPKSEVVELEYFRDLSRPVDKEGPKLAERFLFDL